MVPLTLHWELPELFSQGSEDVVDMSVLLLSFNFGGKKRDKITRACPPSLLLGGNDPGTHGCSSSSQVTFQNRTRQESIKRPFMLGVQHTALW